MAVKVFIDGQAGTTGLRIHERLADRNDLTMITLTEETRKDPEARRAAILESDVTFLCLPDDAAREAVALAGDADVRIIDASTAHRTNPDWAYGFPELSPEHREKIRTSKRVAVPGCYASGFASLVYPMVHSGLLPKDYPVRRRQEDDRRDRISRPCAGAVQPPLLRSGEQPQAPAGDAEDLRSGEKAHVYPHCRRLL